MGISEVAKSLRQEAVSEELQWLRKIRAYVKDHPNEWLIGEFAKLEAYEKTAEGSGWEGAQRICKRVAELHEIGCLKEFYEKVLQYAEGQERKEKGGGEKGIRLHRKELMEMERNLRQKWERERRLQVRMW